MKTKFTLRESEMPRQWYNLAADLPTPMLPPLGPDGNPVTPDKLAPVFPMNLIEQEIRRPTLLAAREERDGGVVYRFDIRLQGENETVFLDV